MTTSAPRPYGTWRAEAAARDRAYAAAYRAGYEAHRTEHRRLWVLGAIAAVFLFARRLPVLGFLVIALWAVLVVVALWPLVFVGVAIELTLRQHRRWRSWGRTVGYALTWPGCLALGYLALVARSAWPLVGIAVLVVAWLVEGKLREHRSMRHGTAPTGPEPFQQEAPLLAGSEASPYRVVFTAKARHVETRRYPDGMLRVYDTMSGEPVDDDPYMTW